MLSVDLVTRTNLFVGYKIQNNYNFINLTLQRHVGQKFNLSMTHSINAKLVKEKHINIV